jgi:hypothetical protein
MSITVRPDPYHPLGGHALLEIDQPLAQGPVSVSIMDLAEERYLGPKGWQQAPVALGPFEARDDGGKVVVPVGPGIVDNIDEYTTLKLTVGGVSAQLSWPDTIRTSPDRIGLGGLGMLAGSAPAKPPPPPPPAEPTAPPEAPVPPERPPESRIERSPETIDPVPDKPKSLLVPILLGLVLLAAIAGVVWYVVTQMPDDAPTDGIPDETNTTSPPPPPPPPQRAAGCDAAGLAAAAEMDPAPAFEAIAGCGAGSDADQRLAIIERAADAGVPAAIAMIGRWYDPAQAEAVGSGFATRDAGQAARYYHEALAAGYEPAQPLLDAACAALDPATNPLHEIAREDYCN